MTENNVTELPLTEQDERDLSALNEEEPAYHTILEVWREVLRPAAEEVGKKVTPGWASRICSQFQEVTFKDMNTFRDAYFSKILELAAIIDVEIASDSDSLTYTTPEEDSAENSHHYKNLLLVWQQAVLQWELDWDCTSKTAAVELAAISEVHKMFFGDTGLTAYLDNIKFEYTEDDQRMLAEALEEQREAAQ